MVYLHSKQMNVQFHTNDIKEFYPSITKSILDKALDFAKQQK